MISASDYPCETLLPSNNSFNCTVTTVFPEPEELVFRTSEYNAPYNNATNLRRIQGTGSLDGTIGGVFELDKKASQITPTNLEAVLSGSAVTASFQESNIYSKTWTSGRYDGTKLDSGSLYYNDPALTFKPFEAARFNLFESSSLIRSKSFSDLDIETLYFNPPHQVIRTGLTAYLQGSVLDSPPSSQPIYELDGKEFKRVTKAKLYLPNTDDIIQLEDYQAFYETRPSEITAVVEGDNVFTVMVETLLAQDFYSYYTGSDNSLVSSVEIRPGTSDVIQISGSYIPSTNSYAIDIIDGARGTHAIFSDGRNTLNNKTSATIISSSNNA